MQNSKLKRNLKEYFNFNKLEQQGIILLLFIILLVIVFRFQLPFFNANKKPIDISKFEAEIAQFEIKSDSLKKSIKSKKYYQPDTLKYTIKFNKLYQSDSLKRKTNFSNKPRTEIAIREKHTALKIEINTSDSTQLIQLSGIGDVFARRMIKYREILGGYYSIQQLSEVFGITTETIDKIKNNIAIDTSKILKISINIDDFKKVNKHPYITYEQTKAIFKLRATQKINSCNQLTESLIFSPSEILKIKPYLDFR